MSVRARQAWESGSDADRTRLSGVLAPVLTPFRSDLSPDAARFVRHCRWLLSQGCAGLAVFGTTSEANSLSVEEREALLEELLGAGIDPAKLLPGTGCCALSDSVRLTRAAVRAGCAGVLMLPPFYYKGVSEDGLFRSFAEVIERVGDARLRAYLYHIPPVAQVGFSVKLVERLVTAYPSTVAGVKDSSGDWSNTKAMLDAFAKSGFDVFAGSEVFLLENMRAGGVGCITATGNINPGAINKLFENWRGPSADALQKDITATRGIMQKYPMMAALKAVIAHFGRDPDWATLRPPLVELTPAQSKSLIAEIEARCFEMPGLAAPAVATA